MTDLAKAIRRRAQKPLGHAFGSDKGRRLVVTILPAQGENGEDLIELRPEGTRRPEVGTLEGVYLYLIRGRVNRQHLEKARVRKAKKAEQRERAAIARKD